MPTKEKKPKQPKIIPGMKRSPMAALKNERDQIASMVGRGTGRQAPRNLPRGVKPRVKPPSKNKNK